MYTQFTMRMARFVGVDKNEFIDNQRVEGNIFVLLNEAMNFFRKHLNMNGKVVGLVREDMLEIPTEALREAILNALCHRQYEKFNLTISIAIFDDRIEISNPGILPPQITTENIIHSHDSAPYNPLIANVLYNSSYIENWGSGVSRIIKACRKANLAAPQWSTNAGFVVVTFCRPISDATTEKTTEKTTDTILKQIQANPNITTQELAEKFGMTTDGIFYHIKKLKLQHRIVREGGRKNGHWIVNE